MEVYTGQNKWLRTKQRLGLLGKQCMDIVCDFYGLALNNFYIKDVLSEQEKDNAIYSVRQIVRYLCQKQKKITGNITDKHKLIKRVEDNISREKKREYYVEVQSKFIKDLNLFLDKK